MSLKQPCMLATPPELSGEVQSSSLMSPVFLPMKISMKQISAAKTLYTMCTTAVRRCTGFAPMRLTRYVVRQSPILTPMITANTALNVTPTELAIDCMIPTTADELCTMPVTTTPERNPRA